MSDNMFQPFNYMVVNTGIIIIFFYNSLVEKSHKDTYVTQTTIQEVQNIPFQKYFKGQMSANFRINVQYITLECSLNRFPIWNCNKTI